MLQFLLDLDGTLYTESGPIPGVVETVQHLRRRGIPVRFVTNTTRRPRRALVERLRGYGFEVEPDEVMTAVLAGAAYLRAQGLDPVAPLVTQETLEDLEGLTLIGGTAPAAAPAPPAAVLIGDLGDDLTHALLNEAFRYVMDGARLVALQKGRYWQGADGLLLDAGAYVAALEYATGEDAVACGKPSEAFFHAAVQSFPRSDVPSVMVGDDLMSDVHGAQQAGLQGWLVKTGKFRQEVLEKNDVRPDRILDSVADLLDIDV